MWFFPPAPPALGLLELFFCCIWQCHGVIMPWPACYSLFFHRSYLFGPLLIMTHSASQLSGPLSLESLRHACENDAGLAPFCNDSKTLQGLFTYLSILQKWNKVMNLVGPYSWQEILRLLLVDSAWLAAFLAGLQRQEMLAPEPESWDLGAGAGLPGIPLRLLWEKGMYSLVDARQKRTLFLRTVLAAHILPQTLVYEGRAEQFMPTRPNADLVVSRAFMPWQDVLTLVGPHLAPGGVVVFLVLQPAPKQADMAQATCGVPGLFGERWRVLGQQEYPVGGDSRFLWAVSLESNG